MYLEFGVMLVCVFMSTFLLVYVIIEYYKLNAYTTDLEEKLDKLIELYNEIKP